MSTIPLTVSAQGIVAADGTCTLQMGPTVYGQTWTVTKSSVTNDGNTKSNVNLYKNAVTLSSYQEGTRSGNGDTSDTVFDLMFGDSLIAVWQGAQPGSHCLLNLSGTIDTGRA